MQVWKVIHLLMRWPVSSYYLQFLSFSLPTFQFNLLRSPTLNIYSICVRTVVFSDATLCEDDFILKMEVTHSSKHLLPSTRLDSVTTQKPTVDIFTTVRTKNLRFIVFVYGWDFRFTWWQAWRWLSLGILHHVVQQKFTDVSEVHAASIIRAVNISEIMVNFHQPTKGNNPGDSHLVYRYLFVLMVWTT
jgi:hypothetical protein